MLDARSTYRKPSGAAMMLTTDTTALPAGHPRVPRPKTGILIANLGTPDGYDYWSMRRYLNEFLSDRRSGGVDRSSGLCLVRHHLCPVSESQDHRRRFRHHHTGCGGITP